MSRSSITATTTYPYTYTTWSTTLPSSKFTKPTLVPSLFSFAPGISCAQNTKSANPQPSQFPLDRPLGLQGACVISNAEEVNNHAFWDLYSCCKGGDMTAFGSPNTCTAQCRAENGQSFLELGECLSKKVEVVVCKPPFEEIGNRSTSGVVSSSTGSASRVSGSASSSAPASASTGGANVVGVVHGGGAKVSGMVFGILALGAAAGMFL